MDAPDSPPEFPEFNVKPGPLPVVDFIDVEEPLPEPVQRRELIAVFLIALLCDLTVYRGQGFTGYGLLFALAPWLLMLGSVGRKPLAVRWLLVAALTVIAARLVWCGSYLTVVSGLFGVVALAMSLVGRRPQVLGVVAYSRQTIQAGAEGINRYGQAAYRNLKPFKTSAALSIVLPLAALLIFGTVFLMANPDLVASISGQWRVWVTQFGDWLQDFSIIEIPFWIGCIWLTVGLLRPIAEPATSRLLPPRPKTTTAGPVNAQLYGPFRNTLMTVSVLFAGYLVFEFQTLWLREFPKGFHYSGYAHEGAAWLTVALALATVMLSLIFRGEVLQDPRLVRLKRLAWIWSALNLLLAVAVYHRLWIYVGFNGMTRMRMIAFFGTTTVVIGFALAIYKIARVRSFTWLFQADLWALAAAVMIYSVTPVDLLVMRYNVTRILAGDSAPSVQISEHPINAEGLRELLPLMHCEDEIVRDGVKALLAERFRSLSGREIDSWNSFTSLQISERLLREELIERGRDWERFDTVKPQTEAWERFREYAYQWY